VNVEGREIAVPAWDMTKPIARISMDGEDYILQIQGRSSGAVWKIGFQGSSYELRLKTPYTQTLLDIMPQPKSVKLLPS